MRQPRAFRVQGGLLGCLGGLVQLAPAGFPIGKALANLNGVLTTLVCQQWPDPPAAGAGEQV
jgi:hypothetical protein